MEFLSILLSDILPIFAIAGTGYILERRFRGSAATLSAISFNALSPCFVFNQLVTSKISGADAGRMALYCVLLMGTMGIAAWFAAAPFRLERKTLSSFLLVVMFSNSGNYALPVILFAFGSGALAYASVCFVTGSVVLYTAGVFIAASSGSGVRRALEGIPRIPALYALAAAGAIVFTHTAPPIWVMRPVGMLSDAAIPMMVLVLGMQMRSVDFQSRPIVVAAAVAMSLIVGPAVGFLLTVSLGITGAAREAALVLAAMPSAVITTVLALEFDLDSSFVTSVVFVSTLLSPLTLVLLITYLQRP